MLIVATNTAATVGFLTLNRPPARVFMGDVGSTFLGILIFASAVSTVNAGWMTCLHTAATSTSVIPWSMLPTGEEYELTPITQPEPNVYDANIVAAARRECESMGDERIRAFGEDTCVV